MSFIRTIENFTCAHCGEDVKGNGYTNHCPACLWSKHVDNDPGDRASACGALMKPIHIEGTAERFRIIHHCQSCSVEKHVDVSSGDSRESLIALSGSILAHSNSL